MTSRTELTRSVPSARWGEFFRQFTNLNRGRHILVKSINPQIGNLELIEDAPLLSLIYDRPGKGDDLMIEVGVDQAVQAHRIDTPIEVLTGQNAIGELVAVWISGASGVKTMISLQAFR
jgi:Family of unknown function (DUF5335)